MSIVKLVSVKNAVYNAFGDMGKDITNDVPIFTRWASEAAKEIGSLLSYENKIVVLDMDGCSALLPCSTVSVKHVMLGDHGCECDSLFSECANTAISSGSQRVDTAFVVIDKQEQDIMQSNVRWTVQDNQVVLYQKHTGKITVKILAVKEDCDGWVMVSQNSIEAITTYILWKYARRSRFGKVKIDITDMRMLRQDYELFVARARADDAADIEAADRAKIVAMINDPLVGFGMQVYNGPLD